MCKKKKTKKTTNRLRHNKNLFIKLSTHQLVQKEFINFVFVLVFIKYSIRATSEGENEAKPYYVILFSPVKSRNSVLTRIEAK